MVAEVEVVHAVADVHDALLHHPLPDYQLPEVDHALQLLDHLLETHHLQVLVELNVLDDERKAHGLARAQHQVLQHVHDLCRAVLIQRLQVDECDFADLGLQVGRDVALPEQEVQRFLHELLAVAELEVPVRAVLVGALLGVHAIVDRVDYRLHHLQYLSDAGYVGLICALLLGVLLRRFARDVLLLLPKLLVDEVLEVLVDLLHHHHPFQPGPCFLGHEAADEFELVGDSLQVPALEFEVDDPVGDDGVEGGLFADLEVEGLVAPQPVAEHLEQRQHLYLLGLLVVQHLVEEGEEDGAVDYLGTVDDYFVEQPQQVVLDLHVLLLHYAELVQPLQLELDGSAHDVRGGLRCHLKGWLY